jgi:hypothetical protein
MESSMKKIVIKSSELRNRRTIYQQQRPLEEIPRPVYVVNKVRIEKTCKALKIETIIAVLLCISIIGLPIGLPWLLWIKFVKWWRYG